MTRTRPILGLVAAAVLASGLTGCGVAGTGFSPGLAAEVGDTSITTDRVDAVRRDRGVPHGGGEARGEPRPRHPAAAEQAGGEQGRGGGEAEEGTGLLHGVSWRWTGAVSWWSPAGR